MRSPSRWTRHARLTSASFLQYVRDGHYDGTIFHRVIGNFVVQGGGYLPDGTEKPVRAGVPNESGNGLSNRRGTVAVARTENPHSGTSQFYLNVANNIALDPSPSRWGYAVFGRVVEGMDVVDRIASVATGSRRPVPRRDAARGGRHQLGPRRRRGRSAQVNAERRKTLLVSDLHLDPAAPQIARQFIDFLRGEAKARALYILGDLFEAWLGDDDPDPAVRRRSRRRTSRGCGRPESRRTSCTATVISSIGFALRRGDRLATLLDDGSLVDLHGEQVLLMHGDVLCTADTSYQRLRHVLRNPLTLFVLRNLGLESRRRLGRKLRAGSQMHVGATAPDIMDVTPAAVVEALRSAGVRTLVHRRHTHRPAIHTLDVDGKPARRIVLGDWHAQGSVLEWSDGGVELSTLPR